MTGISPEKLLYDKSREVTKGIILEMLLGIGPVKLLLERSRPVKLEQFSIPLGNVPTRPMLERRRFSTRFSFWCQHSTPVNLQIDPSVVLSNFQFRKLFGSFMEAFRVFRHNTSVTVA